MTCDAHRWQPSSPPWDDDSHDPLVGATLASSWAGWVEREPELGSVGSLPALSQLRGEPADGPLGALVRLAARDGGDDEVAAAAVVHLLEPGTRTLARRLRDLSDDIEPIVIGELWAQVRTFPWRRRTHRYAANLLMDTRAGVLRHLQVGRWAEPSVLVGDEVARFNDPTTEGPDARTSTEDDDPAAELAELVAWACKQRLISAEDRGLLTDLIAAGRRVMPLESGWSRKGVCSELALSVVAESMGVSTKTVARHRNRIVAALRQHAQRYLHEVA